MYLPVPCELKCLDAERSGCNKTVQWEAGSLTRCFVVDVLATAKSSESRSAPLLSDMDHIETAVAKLQEMLERISQYVDAVVVSS